MNIVDLIKEATKAGEEWSAGKTDDEIREGVEYEATQSYIAMNAPMYKAVGLGVDYQHWRSFFAVACFR